MTWLALPRPSGRPTTSVGPTLRTICSAIVSGSAKILGIFVPFKSLARDPSQRRKWYRPASSGECARDATGSRQSGGRVVAFHRPGDLARVLNNRGNRGAKLPCGERVEAQGLLAGRFATAGNAL